MPLVRIPNTLGYKYYSGKKTKSSLLLPFCLSKQFDFQVRRFCFKIKKNLFLSFSDLTHPKVHYKPEDIAPIGELLLDISINLAKT